MKWVFAVLVLANVAFFLWGTGFKPSSLPPPKPAHPAIEAEKIRLLTEPGVIVEPRVAKTESLTAITPQNTAQSCFSVGPFDDAAAFTAAGVRLQELGLSYLERMQEDREPGGFRVFIEPFANLKAAEARRRELTRLGVKDHALISEPGRPIGISLGIFSVADNAQNYIRALAKKKVKAKMETLTRTRNSQWLDTYPLDEIAAQRVKHAFADMRGIGVSERVCPASDTPAH